MSDWTAFKRVFQEPVALIVLGVIVAYFSFLLIYAHFFADNCRKCRGFRTMYSTGREKIENSREHYLRRCKKCGHERWDKKPLPFLGGGPPG